MYGVKLLNVSWKKVYFVFLKMILKVFGFSADGYQHHSLIEEKLMECPRCHGTMIVDHFVDMATSGEIWMPGWRCLMCGEIIDPIIESHRQQQQEHPEILSAISGSTARPPDPLTVRPRKASERS